ncbi:hypothetical protein F4781DRAFT_287572 [Annulohypoxylon bovei var. microspora]|nr:hypothetical protein F4781DRAFT_287572 [Annulohypoxylon bovei var. microspora]
MRHEEMRNEIRTFLATLYFASYYWGCTTGEALRTLLLLVLVLLINDAAAAVDDATTYCSGVVSGVSADVSHRVGSFSGVHPVPASSSRRFERRRSCAGASPLRRCTCAFVDAHTEVDAAVGRYGDMAVLLVDSPGGLQGSSAVRRWGARGQL